MSLQNDAMQGVRQMTDRLKINFEKNLKTACERGWLTLNEDKLPGLCKILDDTVDQTISSDTDYLQNVLRAYSRQK
tara:strand:- start:1137 stop:1364 length:228 start_codon:yes stop_codon:yes gene_type:complete